ncbi:hypothetical protein HDU97_007330 [Phlyctochytrium planicorne]|nr:hypothetical protein HDU97_007330 [Phlyctochytrium planicorne]
MPAEMERVLSPPANILEEAMKIHKFQYHNAIRLIKHLKTKVEKTNRILSDTRPALLEHKEKVSRLETANKTLSHENERLNRDLTRMQQRLQAHSAPRQPQQVHHVHHHSQQQQQQQQQRPHTYSNTSRQPRVSVPPGTAESGGSNGSYSQAHYNAINEYRQMEWNSQQHQRPASSASFRRQTDTMGHNRFPSSASEIMDLTEDQQLQQRGSRSRDMQRNEPEHPLNLTSVHDRQDRHMRQPSVTPSYGSSRQQRNTHAAYGSDTARIFGQQMMDIDPPPSPRMPSRSHQEPSSSRNIHVRSNSMVAGYPSAQADPAPDPFRHTRQSSWAGQRPMSINANGVEPGYATHGTPRPAPARPAVVTQRPSTITGTSPRRLSDVSNTYHGKS